MTVGEVEKIGGKSQYSVQWLSAEAELQPVRTNRERQSAVTRHTVTQSEHTQYIPTGLRLLSMTAPRFPFSPILPCHTGAHPAGLSGILSGHAQSGDCSSVPFHRGAGARHPLTAARTPLAIPSLGLARGMVLRQITRP